MRTFMRMRQPGSERGTLAERIRERRDERSQRAEAAAEDEVTQSGQVRTCALTGEPMATSSLQIEIEMMQARQRRALRRAGR